MTSYISSPSLRVCFELQFSLCGSFLLGTEKALIKEYHLLLSFVVNEPRYILYTK